MLKDTLIDKAIAYISPTAAVKRIAAKQALYRYKAASQNFGRNRAVATNVIDPESTTYQRDRWTIIKEVRNLAENSPIVQGILSKYAAYAIGNLKYQANTGDRNLNQQAEEFFKQWARHADTTGRMSLTELAHVAVISERRDGDVGGIWIQKASEAPTLQLVEADRLGDPNANMTTANYAAGIHIDDFGKPLAYDIYTRDRNTNSYTFDRQIVARDFIHHAIIQRPSQYRGVSCFAPVIDKLKDLEEILEAEQIGVKANSMHAAIVFNENGVADVEDVLNADNAPRYSDGSQVDEIEHKYGRFWFLKQGDRVQPMLGNRPSPTFNGFLESIIRDVATALNLPYGVVYNISGLTGPGSRTELSLADREFQRIQGYVQRNLLDPIRDRIMFYGAATGQINADPMNPSLYRGRWQFPAKMSIDAGRDSAAAINEVRAGMRTKSSFYIANGEDPQEAEDKIYDEASTKLERAQELSKSANIPINLALELLGNPSNFQIMPVSEEVIQDEEPEPEEKPEPKEFAEGNKPTQAMADNAKRALEVRKSKPPSERGMTAVGIARARDISNRKNLSQDTVKRMLSYFQRHEVDKKGETWKEQGKGWQAWNGWGGDEGYSWARSIVDKLDK